MNEQTVLLVKLIIQGVLAVVLLVAMTWIVLSPYRNRRSQQGGASRGELGAVGFLFGQKTATP